MTVFKMTIRSRIKGIYRWSPQGLDISPPLAIFLDYLWPGLPHWQKGLTGSPTVPPAVILILRNTFCVAALFLLFLTTILCIYNVFQVITFLPKKCICVPIDCLIPQNRGGQGTCQGQE